MDTQPEQTAETTPEQRSFREGRNRDFLSRRTSSSSSISGRGPSSKSRDDGTQNDEQNGEPHVQVRDEEVASLHDIFATGSPPIPIRNHNETLRRAGLLQSRSYNTLSAMSDSARVPAVPHSQDTIRTNTMELSGMLFSPHLPNTSDPSNSSPGGISHMSLSDLSLLQPPRSTISEAPEPSSMTGSSSGSSHLQGTTTGAQLQPPKNTAHQSLAPSGLSLHRPQNDVTDRTYTSDRDDAGRSILRSSLTTTNSAPGASASSSSSSSTPLAETMAFPSREEYFSESLHSKRSIRWDPSTDLRPSIHILTETSPLLGSGNDSTPPPNYAALPPSSFATKTISRARTILSPQNVEDTLKTAVKSIPAVLLGSLLNILDGISYGMIIFPAVGVFADLGPMGVSMFFLSAVISQLVYTFGGSSFAGANGSMMIEVVPFFHILANSIAQTIGEDHPKEIIATTLVAFAFSSILTGLTFFLLGALKLGVLIGFFPRHILVGCIGGVGAFLIETGLTVSMRIDDDDFQMNWETFNFMFMETHNLILWVLPLALAILLRVITHKYDHQLIFPLYFLVIPIVFYIVVAAGRFDLVALRADGWLFDMGSTKAEKWYQFYTYLDFGLVKWEPLWATLPTQFALLFFNILHPPLNVPALSVSLNEDVDTNKELLAHGYSNILSGLFGTVPNYLVYVNTLLFYRVGGETRIAGFLLAVATFILLLVGTAPIAFIPVMVVGALIFVLGIDLVKEALWDTRHRVSRTEYLTIASIMIVMTVWDFVIGVLFGLVVSCFFFVVQNSQGTSIRALHTGETAMSTVRRPSPQRAYIKEVSRQTSILRLQGHLFFGTITYVEEAIRNIVEGSSWLRNPVRFLVVDLTLVAGVDMSSAEAFVRVQRLLAAKSVTLVFCGFSPESSVGKALDSVGILSAQGVEIFSTFNDAMEWTENCYLRAWFRAQKTETVTPFVLSGRQDIDTAYQHPEDSVGSPRLTHIQDVGIRTIANEIMSYTNADTPEPFNTIVRAFSSISEVEMEQLRPLVSYLERVSVPEGHILWSQGDTPDGLYLIESGVLRASYRFADHAPSIEESMIPGTLAGELSAMSNLPRNATAVVERPAVLWKLTTQNMRRLESEEPALSRLFMHLILKAAKIDYDILLSALATRQ